MNDEPVLIPKYEPVELPKQEPKPSLVTVEIVWKKPRDGVMLVRYGKNFYLVSDWKGQNVFNEVELRKNDKPFPFADKIAQVLPTPQEIQAELYRTGVVHLSDVGLNTIKILFNKMLDPVKIFTELLRG